MVPARPVQHLLAFPRRYLRAAAVDLPGLAPLSPAEGVHSVDYLGDLVEEADRLLDAAHLFQFEDWTRA